jgi:cytosine/adenosine deaminase-related metal-dependent hydrolase
MLVLAASAPSVVLAQGTPPRATAFVDVNIVSMANDRLLAGQTVVVENGTITGLGPAGRVRVPDGAEIVAGAGKYLMPGLTDLHVHMVGPPEVQRSILKLFVANGVTTILNARGTPEHLALRAAIARREVLGPAMYTVGPYVNEPFVSTPDSVEAAVVAQRRAGYDFIKMHGELSREAYARLIAVGRREGIRIIGHAPRTLGIEVVFEERQYALMHAEEYLYDRTGNSRDSAELMPHLPRLARLTAAAGTWVMPNLVAFRTIGVMVGNLDSILARPDMRYLPPPVRDGWGPATNPYTNRFATSRAPHILASYRLMVQFTRQLEAAGVGLLIGTDAMNTGVIPGFSVHEEMLELSAAGLTPYEVLRTATVNAADFLGERDRRGTVAVGQRADLLLLDANPLVDLSNTRRRAGVMLHGRWLPEAEISAMLDELLASYARQGP